jgi:nicotinamide mononucleotide adenylyltransferase
MGRRFVQLKDGSLVEIGKYVEPTEPQSATVRGDVPAYFSHATNRWIEGAVQRREDLEVSGCRPFEGRESEERERLRNMQYNEDARDRAVEKQVREIAPYMPSEVRRMLQGEEVTGHAPNPHDVLRAQLQRRR